MDWDPERESLWGQRYLNQAERARHDRDQVRMRGGSNTLGAAIKPILRGPDYSAH